MKVRERGPSMGGGGVSREGRESDRGRGRRRGMVAAALWDHIM